jgi:disulfide bond formation protein DsbB
LKVPQIQAVYGRLTAPRCASRGGLGDRVRADNNGAMRSAPDRLTVFLVLLTGIGALCVALGAEHFLGMAPCPLCFWERWPYRALILLGAIGLFLPAVARRVVLWLAALVFVCAMGLALLHVGVEHHWWPSPLPECNAPNLRATSVANLIASMPMTPSKPCDAPNYLIPWLPISFATMDLILAAVGAALLTAYLGMTTGRART